MFIIYPNMYMYIYIHICMYVIVCMDGWMDVCMDGWMDACMHACMDGCMHACMYIYILICVCIETWCTVYGCYGTKKLAAGSSTHRHLPEFSSGKPHFLGGRMGWQWAWARPNMVDTRKSHKIASFWWRKWLIIRHWIFTHSPHIKGAPQRQYQKKLGSHSCAQTPNMGWWGTNVVHLLACREPRNCWDIADLMFVSQSWSCYPLVN